MPIGGLKLYMIKNREEVSRVWVLASGYPDHFTLMGKLAFEVLSVVALSLTHRALRGLAGGLLWHKWFFFIACWAALSIYLSAQNGFFWIECKRGFTTVSLFLQRELWLGGGAQKILERLTRNMRQLCHVPSLKKKTKTLPLSLQWHKRLKYSLWEQLGCHFSNS